MAVGVGVGWGDVINWGKRLWYPSTHQLSERNPGGDPYHPELFSPCPCTCCHLGLGDGTILEVRCSAMGSVRVRFPQRGWTPRVREQSCPIPNIFLNILANFVQDLEVIHSERE